MQTENRPLKKTVLVSVSARRSALALKVRSGHRAQPCIDAIFWYIVYYNSDIVSYSIVAYIGVDYGFGLCMLAARSGSYAEDETFQTSLV